VAQSVQTIIITISKDMIRAVQSKPSPLPAVVAAQAATARSFELWLEACRKHEAARSARPTAGIARQASGNVSAATVAVADAKAKKDTQAAMNKRANLGPMLPGLITGC
jgi:hypothetical protein